MTARQVWCDCCSVQMGRPTGWLLDPANNFDLCPECLDAEATGFPCRRATGWSAVCYRTSLAGLTPCATEVIPPSPADRRRFHAYRRKAQP